MDISSILNGISIGKDTSGNFRLTIEGLAVRAGPSDRFFVNRNDRLIDVTDFVLDGAEDYVYRLPVRKEHLKPGDLIITSEDPFALLFVRKVHDNGRLVGLDPGLRQEVEYVPPTSAVFDVTLYVKVVSLLDGLGLEAGNDALLLLLLLGSKGSRGTSDDTLALLLLSLAMGGKGFDKKLLPLLLLGGGASGSLENLLLIQALTGSGGSLSGLFGRSGEDLKP